MQLLTLKYQQNVMFALENVTYWPQNSFECPPGWNLHRAQVAVIFELGGPEADWLPYEVDYGPLEYCMSTS